MADSTSSQLQRLQLSAADLKKITADIKSGEPWPDALVEDYLNILRDLVLLADEIDQSAVEIIESIDKLRSSIQANKSQASQNRSRSLSNKKRISDLANEIGQGLTDVFEFFPVKACSIFLNGTGASTPTVSHSYNVGSFTRTGVGTYSLNLSQDTINGQSIFSRATYSLSHKISPSANTSDFRFEVDSFISPTVVLKVYEVTVGSGGAGSDLVYTPYDLQFTDVATFNILMNAGAGTLPPA